MVISLSPVVVGSLVLSSSPVFIELRAMGWLLISLIGSRGLLTFFFVSPYYSFFITLLFVQYKNYDTVLIQC